MRQKLAVLNSSELKGISATVRSYGCGRSQQDVFVKYVCLTNVKLGEELLTDHVWVEVPTSLDAIGIRKGDTITFDACVEDYSKGPRNHRVAKDFKLACLTNIRRSKP